MQEEITHMQQVFLSREINLLKTPMPTCNNQMNRDLLQFLCSSEHNLSLYSLKTSNIDLVNFYLCLSSYFLALYLEELAPIIQEIPLIELHNSLVLSSNCMQHVYTQYYFIIDVTLPWNLHLNQVTRILCMHYIFLVG